MSTSIATLSVMLTANSDRYSTTMRKSRKEAYDLKEEVRQASSAVTAYGLALDKRATMIAQSTNTYGMTGERLKDRTAFEQQVRDDMAARMKAMRAESLKHKISEEANRRMFGSQAQVEEAGREAGAVASKGFISELNKNFGKRSALGKSLNILAGGGAIGGLALAAGELNEFTQKVEEFSLAMSAGKLHAGEFVTELVKGLPIIGSLVQAGERLSNLFSGTTQYVAEMNEKTRLLNMVTDAQKTRMKIVEESAKSTKEYIAQVERSIERLSKSGMSLKFFDIDTESQRGFKEIKEWFKGVTGGADLTKMKENVATLKEELGKMPRTEWVQNAVGGVGFGGVSAKPVFEEVASRAYKEKELAIKEIEKQIASLDPVVADMQSRVAENEKKAMAERTVVTLGAYSSWGGAALAAAQEWGQKIKAKAAEFNREQLREQQEANRKKAEESQRYVDDMNRQGEQLREAAMSPIEKRERELTRLNRLLDEGYIGWREYTHGVQQANKSLQEAAGPVSAPTIMAGSAEAQRWAYDNARGKTGANKDDIPAKQLNELQEVRQVLREMLLIQQPPMEVVGMT